MSDHLLMVPGEILGANIIKRGIVAVAWVVAGLRGGRGEERNGPSRGIAKVFRGIFPIFVSYRSPRRCIHLVDVARDGTDRWEQWGIGVRDDLQHFY